VSRTSVAAACAFAATALSIVAAAPQSQPPRAPANPPISIQRPQPTEPPPPQQPPQPPPRVPQPFRGQVNLVRVDVYATKDGVPIDNMTAADFEVLEDGKPQTIDTFEHIVVRPALGEAEMKEPGSMREAVQAVADPHRRVFVVFLDTEHVDVGGSHNIRQPLIDLLTRVLGPDDLAAVMTPTMSPSQMTFARKTQVIEEGLTRNWDWGRRNTILLDEQEKKYDYCFPPLSTEHQSPSALAMALIKRRREKITLDSLQDLIRYMAAVREGRTAVIAVSDGWLRYRPDQSLTVLRVDQNTGQQDPMPGAPPPVGVGPGGTLTTRGKATDPWSSTQYECEKDRMELAMMDNDQYFRDIEGEANRSNVTFYPIDPRGLVVFDSPMGPEPPPTLQADAANLRTREDSLREIALNTDGIALLNRNDLSGQIKRVAADLTSYYLIGYYSTNAKLDGKFRAIKVRSKRPGIDIRARRGYRAATPEEVASARTAAEAPHADTTSALTAALGALDSSARGARIRQAPGEPLVLRRGPSTGNVFQRADVRVFPRSDRLRFELEAASGESLSGTLLTRTGSRLAIPVTVGERMDGDARKLLADLTLAPLGAGDYVVELTITNGSEHRTVLTAIRVTQ
jgi:VWFA-related protein